MKSIKLLLAVALYTTSVSFEEQVLISDQGVASFWEVSVGTNHAMALKFE